jgi:hypothetical protein
MRWLSLRLRLTLLTTLLTGGTVLLFALLFYLILQANLLSGIDQRLRERAALVITALQSSNNKQDSSARLLAITALVEFDAPGIYVEVIAPDGEVRARSPNLPADSLSSVAPFVTTARAHGDIIGTVPASDDDQLRFLVTPVRVGVQPGNVLIVAESLEPFLHTLPPARARSDRPGRDPFERLLVPDRDAVSGDASRLFDRRSADHFPRPACRPVEDVAPNRAGGAADGLALALRALTALGLTQTTDLLSFVGSFFAPRGDNRTCNG